MADDFTKEQKASLEAAQSDLDDAKSRVVKAKAFGEKLKAIQKRTATARQDLNAVERIIKNSTTPSGPPMATMERVSSVLGSMGGLNAAAQAADHAASFEKSQKSHSPKDAFMVTGEAVKKFAEVYATDAVRAYVQAVTGTRMAAPGRVEGVDIAKRVGVTGWKGKALGAGMEMLADPTTAGVGPVAASFKYTGRAIAGGVNLARKVPAVGKAYSGVARLFNKFHDVEQLHYGNAVKATFKGVIGPDGELNTAKFLEAMSAFTTQNMAKLANVKGAIGPNGQINAANLASAGQSATKGYTTRVPSLKGMEFDKPVADLIEKEWLAQFNSPVHSALIKPPGAQVGFGAMDRGSFGDKVLGTMKDATDVVKKAVTVIDPVFHVRNFFDGLYKNMLEKVSTVDYFKSAKLLLSKDAKSMAEKKDFARHGIIGQVGEMDVKGGLLSKVGTALNDIVRLPMAIKTIRKGGSLSDAASAVNRTHIDYRAAMNSPFINALSNRMIPFAKYEAGNPWTYLTSMPRFAGRQSMAEKVQRNSEDEKNLWNINPADRGKMRFGGWTNLGTSAEDLASVGDKGLLNRLLGAVNPLVKLIAEKVTGYSQYRGRDIKDRESGEKYRNMPGWFLEAVQARRDGGKLTINGQRDASLSIFNRAASMSARGTNLAEGQGSWLSAITGLRPVQPQEPWQANKEYNAVRKGSTRSLWPSMPWTTEAHAAEIPRGQYQIPTGGATRIKHTGAPDDVAAKWGDLSDDKTLKGADKDTLNARYTTDRFALGDVSPAEKARQTRILDLLRFANEVDKAVAKTAPIGSQTKASNEATIRDLKNTAFYKTMPADQLNARIAAIQGAGGPISIPFEQKLKATQGNQDEGMIIRRLLLSDKSMASWMGEKRTQGMLSSPEKIMADIQREMFGQIAAAEAEGRNFNTPEGRKKIKDLRDASAGAQVRLIDRWFEEMTRNMDQVGDLMADAEINPLVGLQMKGENAVKKWLHSEQAITMMKSGESDQIENVGIKTAAIQADFTRQIEKKRVEILKEEAAQIEAFVREKTAAATAILKESFESGTSGLTAFYQGQRNAVMANADELVSRKSDLLGATRGKATGDDPFIESMMALAQSGNFEELNKHRRELTDAGVDTKAFFDVAAEIAKIVLERSRKIAELATGEKAARDQYEIAIASLQADTANTGLQAKGMEIGGVSLADKRTAFTDQFDAESEKKHIALADSLKFKSVSEQELNEMNLADAQRYYKSKEELEAADIARGQLRTATLDKMDRDHWMNRVQNAQVGVDSLVTLTTNLYEISGKKSKEAFFLMKTAAVASAIVKGYQAAVAAYTAGVEAGGPYGLITGAAFAAISSASTGVQIAMIKAQGMATGGAIKGGSGKRDDVPIMAMGGEYMMQQTAVKKYGERFMNAINEGKAEPRDFVIPSLPARIRSGSSYAEGGLVAPAAPMETMIVLENKTGQNMKMTDGGAKFDGKKMVRSVIFELADTDPQFLGLMRTMGGSK